MSLSTHRPVKGTTYGVVCPVCCNPMDFECLTEAMYGVRCPVCNAMIDLRNPAETLPDTDTGVYVETAERHKVVHYSSEVEPSVGMVASAQVNKLVESLEAEKRRVMPSQMTGETMQAFSAQRSQAMMNSFSFLFPVTYAIEYIFLGRTPYAEIGNVRIFRKRIPLYGHINICAPRTTTSYSMPLVFSSVMFILFSWFYAHMGLEWMTVYYRLECVLLFSFYWLTFRLAYSDPGYVKPGYMDDDGGDTTTSVAARDVTLRDIEYNKRESLWENVDGVPMERKWCSTCNMYRPLRAAHCYICGLCCYDHDHHCSVVGVCVGRRRIEMFILLVLVSTVSCQVPLVVVVCGLWTNAEKITSSLHLAACFLMIVLLFVYSTFLSGTSVSMLASVAQEMTTRERIQQVYAAKRNPYNRGFLRNTYYHLVQRQVAPSLFNDEFVKKCLLQTQIRTAGTGFTITCV